MLTVSSETQAGNAAAYLMPGHDADRVALDCLDGVYTYGVLATGAARVAGLLSESGAERGDRVLLMGENSFFWVASYLGILQGGFVCVPLPATVPPEDLSYIVQVTGAKHACIDQKALRRNRAGLTGAALVTGEDLAGLEDGSSPLTTELRAEAAPDDLAAIMFTSGSTGRPRGVMVSHRNIAANTASVIEYLGLDKSDRMMTILPFHYCFGTSLLHTHLRVGGTLVVDSRFLYPETLLQRMDEAACTGFAGVPSHFQILLRNSSLPKKRFPHLRHVQQAGGYLAPPLVQTLREALPGVRVYVMYGQTEATARLSYLPPELLDSKAGSVGKGIPGVKLRVLNDAGGEVRPGEEGEIVAEGPNVALGYWRCPEESAECFRAGKLYTGDRATVDEDGFIYIVGRAKDFVKCGGERVSCREVESVLLASEDIVEAAVIGVPDPVLGEAVKAFVTPRGPAASSLAEDLLRHCRQRMRAKLVPKEIVVVRSLPKNSAGKVLKAQLNGASGS
jgi:long-chain acyl-CoA synthetase